MTESNSWLDFHLATYQTRVDWRWARARILAQSPDVERWGVDRATRRAADHLRSRWRGDAAAGPPALVRAVAIRSADGPARDYLEALLLTRLSTAQAARKARLPRSVARAYRSLFFDVRPRDPGWSIVLVVGVGSLTGFPAEDPGLLWKWAAFRGGVKALDQVVAATTGVGRDRYTVEELEAAELYVLRQQLSLERDRRVLHRLEAREAAETAGLPAAAYHWPRPGKRGAI